jgi:hypothetical protein
VKTSIKLSHKLTNDCAYDPTVHFIQLMGLFDNDHRARVREACWSDENNFPVQEMLPVDSQKSAYV